MIFIILESDEAPTDINCAFGAWQYNTMFMRNDFKSKETNAALRPFQQLWSYRDRGLLGP